MVWIYYKFARVEQNCGKQRQLKQLPDEMWIRKPMSGSPGPTQFQEGRNTRYMEPQTVRTSKLQNEAWMDLSVQVSPNGQDGLGEFYD
jgi:hypothetical protein